MRHNIHVIHDKRLIYLEINKCASTSIVRALRKLGSQHVGYEDNDFPTRLTGYYRFTFVRNPWDRIVSLFSNLQDRPELGRELAFNFRIRSQTFFEKSFEKFVGYLHGRFDNGADTHFRSQHLEFPSKLIIPCHFIGRFEKLSYDWKTLQMMFGLPDLGSSQKSQHQHYSSYYDDTTKKLVEERYCIDITKFNYKFIDQDS